MNSLQLSSTSFTQSSSQKTNEPQMFSYYNGSQTIIHFPFFTYQEEAEEEIEEVSTRKYNVQVQDLEYEEFEDFSNPSNNYKQIKYPYQQNWERVFVAPQFIQDIIAEQKGNQVQLYQNSQLNESYSSQSQQESYIQLSPQKESQYQQAVKHSSYIPKSSVNFLDETYYKSSSDISLSASYFNNSVNYLPYEL